MKINVSFQKPFGSKINEIKQWIWMFKWYTACYGFITRIFGVYINVRENDATNKILEAIRKNKKEQH